MKFMKRDNVYKASNVIFNPTTIEAFSYSWWKFVAVIEGKVIFNNYRYSPTTGNHQRKVRNLMTTLGIKIDMELPLPQGIKSDMSLAEMIETAELYLCNKFLSDEIKKQERNEKNREKRAAQKITKLTLVSQDDETGVLSL